MRRDAATAAGLCAVLLSLAGCTATAAPSDAPSSGKSSAAALPAEPRILFEWIAATGPHRGLFLASEDGQEPVPITQDVAEATEHVHSDWSRDGTKMAFEALVREGPASIWVADADGAHAVETITCESQACLQQSFPAWSPDGRSILFAQYDRFPDGAWGPSSIVVFDLATRVRSTVATTPDGASVLLYPRWSPDGRQVVAQYETYRDATESELTSCAIVVVPTDGSTAPVTLTDPAIFAEHPDWSPTEDLIVFDSYDSSAPDTEPASSNLQVIRPDGSGQRQLTSTSMEDGERVGEPSWTPTGDRIIAAVGHFTSSKRLLTSAIASVDPESGDISETGTFGAQPRLQPGR